MSIDVATKRCRVLKNIFGSSEYTPEQVAELRWVDLAKINNCGAQTINEIRRWLGQFGLDIKDVPAFIDSSLAKDKRLLWAMVELETMGFLIKSPAALT